MVKRISCFVLPFLFLFCLGLPSLKAEEDILDHKNKLKDVRWQIQETTGTYKQDLAKTKKESAAKLVALKKEFHKTRAQYIALRKAKEAELKGAYGKKIEPMKEQESELLNLIEPRETDNFAKRR